MAPDDGETSQPSKRRKVAESCKACRAKKTRCDGQRPGCSPCMSKGLVCEYNDVMVSVPAGNLADLDARLRVLEQQATTTPEEGPARTAVPAPPAIGRHLELSCSPRGGQTPSRAGNGDPGGGAELSFPDRSTAQFIYDITQMADHRSAAPAYAPLRASKAGAWTVETDTSAMVVPSRAIADDLVDCYEKYVYPLFPILHLPTFRKSYGLLWEPQPRGQFETLADEATFYATLNIVFALGCLTNSQVKPGLKLQTADTFYRRARSLLPLDALDVVSLGVVQCLLMTTNYLSLTKYSNRYNHTLAVAMRIAQTLGLHVDAEPSPNNQLAREMGRRVWYHCLTLERLFSTVFGYDTRLGPDKVVPLPETIDDEYLLEEGIGSQPAGTPSLIEAFIVTIKTFEVVEGARKINYGSFINGLRLHQLTKVLELNEKIDDIEKNMPSHLQYDFHARPSTPRAQVLHLQAEAAMTRLLHLRLVLLRPNVLASARHSLMSPVSGPPPSRTETALRTEVSSLCVQAAVSAITMLHANLRTASRILSGNAVYVTLSAATVIVAASLVPELDVSIDSARNPYGDAIVKAFEVMDEHRWQNEGARGAKELLKGFQETVHQVRRKRGVAEQASNESSSQQQQGRDGSGLEDGIGGFDFSDPLWNFQWGASMPSFSMPGPMLDISSSFAQPMPGFQF